MPRLLRLARVGRWPRIVAAFACLLLAGVSALDSSHRGASGARATSAPTRVLMVAARTLPAGHVLAGRDLTRARVAQSALPDGAYTSAEPLMGRRLAGAVTTHEPLTRTRLVGTDLAAGLAAGTVAVPVIVTDDVAGLVRPGDRVDLLALESPDTLGTGGDPANAAASSTGTTHDAGRSAKHSGEQPEVVASRAQVLAVLAGAPGDGSSSATQLVVATTREVAVRLAALRVTRMFTAVVDNP